MNRILFEWKMIIRNKYLSQTLILMVFLTIGLYFLILSNPITKDYFVCRIFFLVTLFSIPGSYYGIFSLGTMASFIEKLMISPTPLFHILLSKYYIYCLYSTLILLLAFPLNMGTDRLEIIASYLFAIGFMLFAFLRCTLLGNSPVNIKASGFQNWQGASFESLITVMILGIVAGFIAAIYWLAGETITLVVISFVGACFILMHKYWIKSICRSMEKTKQHRMECYRKNGE